MKQNLWISHLIILIISLTSCSYKVKEFTTDELKWFKPFDKTDTIVFISEKNEWDSIIFQKAIATGDTSRSVEVGYYNMNFLTVAYEFSKWSYHQSAMMSDGKKRYEHHFINMSKSSSDDNSIEITFIGTIFSDKTLKNIQQIDSSNYFFESEKGDYSGMNVEKGIKDFSFNTNVGIVSYTDNRSIKWKRR